MSLLSSIIIPHYDQVDYLSICLQAVSRQSGLYEVIVVDNGTPGLDPDKYIDQYPQLTWLTDTTHRNPYVLRNKGMAQAKGDYILFLDAKCRPRDGWLSEMTSMLSQNDLVAGRYELNYASGQLKDKVHGILYLNNEKNVREGFGVSVGNLGVNRRVFDTMGMFPEEHHSGGDIMWSLSAIAQGYRLAYVDSAIVDYSSPSWDELVNKVKKYGKGAATQGVEDAGWKKRMPLSRKIFKEALIYRDLISLSKKDKLKLWYYASVIKQQYYAALRNA